MTTRLGLIDSGSLKRGYVHEALTHLAEVADRTGTHLAVETSGDPGLSRT